MLKASSLGFACITDLYLTRAGGPTCIVGRAPVEVVPQSPSRGGTYNDTPTFKSAM